MIRSGDHALWDAHVAASEARAEYAARRALLRAVARDLAPVVSALGISARRAADQLAASFRACEAAIQSNPELERLWRHILRAADARDRQENR